jgi:UDP:flavonoid glycosyltransferase YjiC (YdhE family)
MHYLMTPVGSAGDNYPFVGLGVELARRGHRVTVLTNDHFAPVVRGSGLEFLSLGSDEEYRGFLADPEIWHPKRGLKTIMAMTADGNRRIFAAVEHFVREHGQSDSAVVAGTLDFASRAIAEKTGLPVVTVHLSPSVVRTAYDIGAFQGTRDLSWLPAFVKRGIWWAADRFVIDPAAGPVANEMRAKAGLPPVKRVFTRALHSPLLTIGMWPAWFSAPQPDYPLFFRQTGFPLFDAPDAQPVSADVDAYLNASEPPIVYTAGSANVHAHAFFAAACDAANILGRRTMLLSRFTEHLPATLPPNVIHFPFAPLSRILVRCAALVHHGGIGTTAAALAAGVPQLIMPMSHDQPNNAHWVTKMGTGGRLLPKNFTAPNAAAVLAELLNSEQVKRACAKSAERCARQDAIADTADLIEKTVSAARPEPNPEP